MGIDIYVNDIYQANRSRWEPVFNAAVSKRDFAKTEAAKKRHQAKVWEAYDAMNAVGYLREAYHGGPYVTRYLVREAFEAKRSQSRIRAATLRERLPAAVLLAIYREQVVYSEAETAPGHLTLDDGGDALRKSMASIFGPGGEIDQLKSGDNEAAIVERITPEQREQAVAMIAQRKSLPDCALQYVEFVEQCEAREAETGKPCLVEASY